ncbi:MAG: carboxypeptidase regulatory-like domain-containing protein [Acidobacteria bacterium]|nr:carboxypeptidase regulatory-like domain-containing protein [Acidobacteriota bacterium]
MNAKHESKFTMYRGVERHLETNSDIIAAVPAVGAAFEAFRAVIAAIVAATRATGVNLSGIAVDKSNSRQTLAQTAADIAGFIRAYATVIGNNTLRAEVNYPVSKIVRIRDEQVVPRCQIIHDRGAENLRELESYGVTQSRLDELQRAIDLYAAKTPVTRAALSHRKMLNQKLRDLFREGDEILGERLDPLMRNFRTTAADFYRTYESIREIRDPLTTPTTLKGRITDAADGTPVKGAAVTLVGLGETAVTDSRGEYRFKPVDHGRHLVRIVKEGYQTFENDEIDVKLGDIKHLDVGLVR